MKNKIITLLGLALAGLCLVGCASTRSQSAAKYSQKIVEQFKLDQGQRVEKVNAQYQKNFAELSKQLCLLLREDAEQSLDEDAVQIADSLTKDWQTGTLPGKFRDALLQTVESDYVKLRASEKTLDDARNTYAKNYQNASLPLALLKQIDDDLGTLAVKPDDSKQLNGAISALWDAYRKTTSDKTPAATK